MEKLSERFMFYAGLLVSMAVTAGVEVIPEDLKHISDLLDAEEQGLVIVKERPRGEWVYSSETEDSCAGWVCSNCNASYWFPFAHKDFNFCPNCGADMRGEKK